MVAEVFRKKLLIGDLLMLKVTKKTLKVLLLL